VSSRGGPPWRCRPRRGLPSVEALIVGEPKVSSVGGPPWCCRPRRGLPSVEGLIVGEPKVSSGEDHLGVVDQGGWSPQRCGST
jgi:hypothetical protein